MTDWKDETHRYQPGGDRYQPVGAVNTLRPIRERALNHLSAIITAEWGDRCARLEAGCASCVAWAAFDMIERITEGNTLDDADDFARANDRFNLTK